MTISSSGIDSKHVLNTVNQVIEIGKRLVSPTATGLGAKIFKENKQ